MSIVIHKCMSEPTVLKVSQRKELKPYDERIKKATANLARRMSK